MRNTVKKLLLIGWHNIGAIESWLTDMAMQGLRLKKIGKIFAYFEVDAPVKAKYRVKMFDCLGPSKEQDKIFREFEWELAATKKDIYVYRCNNNECTELPIDEKEMECRGQHLNGVYRRTFGLTMFVLMNIIAHNLFDVYISGISLMIKRGFILLILLYIAFIVLIIILAIQYFNTRKKIYNNDYKYYQPWRRVIAKRVFFRIAYICVCLLLTILISIIYLPTIIGGIIESKQSYEQIDMLKLSQIEGEALDIEEEKDSLQDTTFSTSFFAPVQVLYMTETSESKYMKIQYYELRYENMAQRLKEELYIAYGAQIVEGTSSACFDSIDIYEHSSGFIFHIGNNNVVILIDYHGDKTAEQIIPIIEQVYGNNN